MFSFENWTLEIWSKITPENCQKYGFDNWYHVVDVMPTDIYKLLKRQEYHK
jgi:predicted metalloenzyme YecM